MAVNFTFTIQEINSYKKDLLGDLNPKKVETYWKKRCSKNANNNHCNIFCD